MKWKIIVPIMLIVLAIGIATGIYLYQGKNNEININTSIPEVNTTISGNNVLENNTLQNEVSSNENTTIPNNNTVTSNQNLYEGKFELPLAGTTAYASVSLPLYDSSSIDTASKILDLNPGKAFKILKETSNYFYVELANSTKGYVESKYCLVNLPDLIPSIIYDDTNSYKSLFRSSEYELEGITGKALYNVKKYNERLGKEEYIMPLLYPMVEKIAAVQKEAMKNGDSLKIYETFRPYEVQMKVSDTLSLLMESNEEVSAGINSKPWNKTWFIATQLSNHQRGVALDVSLAKVKKTEYKSCGDYSYIVVSEHEEYKMPTKMHELSKAAATFTTPVSSKSKTDWKKAKLASTMTDGAIKLQNYFTSLGFTPLASEWWHFNDLDTRELIKSKGSNGKFYLKDILSSVPNI